jgi:hypothetical protein
VSKYNITAVLNVAWDLDISYPSAAYDRDGWHLKIQYHKVGLVDGLGNEMMSLASAVYFLNQLLTPRILEDKDKNTFPPVQNVLVHCHAGNSRSVVVTALYLFYKHSNLPQFKNFTATLEFVKEKRGIGGVTTLPEPNLLQLATKLAQYNIFDLFPHTAKRLKSDLSPK